MMNKKILIIILLVFTVFTVFSQTKLTLSGIVIDSLSKKPLEYCNLTFKNITDSTKKTIGCITNEEGKYKIDVPLGYNYFMQVSMLGYKTISDTAEFIFEDIENDKNVDYSDIPVEFLKFDEETIELVPEKELLETVTINESTKSIDIDKQSVIVTPEMRKNTIAAKDLFNKLDGVNFNKITEDIKVDGSKKVKLLVDGVEKDDDYILNLNPKRIKKIEILRNISGLYAMDNYTSIVNIITYDNYRGFDFTVDDQCITNLQSKSNPFLTQNNASIGLNITHDKWNYYIKASNNYNNIGILSKSVTNFNANNETIINGNNQSPNSFNKYSNYKITFGSDYRINKKHLLGVEIYLKGLPANSSGKTISFDTLAMNGITTIMQNATNSNSTYNEFSGNLYYKYNIDSTSKLITYFYLKNRQTNNLQNINNEKELKYKKSNSDINYKLEYNKIFSSKYTITTGGRYLANNYKSVTQDTIQDNFTNTFSKLSLYTYLKIRFNKNTGLLIGTSYEYYSSSNNDINTSFNSFQPKINLNKTIKENNKITLEYSIKTKYPYLSDMNPQIDYINSFVASMGNPELSPYLYHNLSIQYSKMNDGFFSYFSVKPYYNYSNNEMGISPITNDSLIIYQNKNYVKHEKYGFFTSFSFEYKEKLSFDIDLDIYKDWNINLNTPNIIDYTGDAQITYSLNTKHYFGLMYQKEYAKNVSSLGYTKEGTDFVMFYWMSLQLKGRLQLMLGYSLPILPTQINEDYEKTPYYVKNNYTDVSFIKNMILVNLVFRISKGKVEKTNKNIDYEDYNQKQGNQDIIGF